MNETSDSEKKAAPPAACASRPRATAAKAGRARFFLVGFGALVAALYVAYGATLRANQNRVIFPGAFAAPKVHPLPAGALRLTPASKSAGDRADGAAPETVLPSSEFAAVSATGGYLWAPLGTAATSRLAILFHGNFERAGDDAATIDAYRTHGFAVLAAEYPGYDAPLPDEERLAASFPNRVLDSAEDLVVRVLRARALRGDTWLLIDGRSIGGFVAVAVARRLTSRGEAPRALVLRSTGARLCDRTWSVGLPPFVCNVPYDNREIPGAFPVLVVHGTNDEIFPIAEGRAIAPAAPRGVFVEVAGGTHNRSPVPNDVWASFFAKLAE